MLQEKLQKDIDDLKEELEELKATRGEQIKVGGGGWSQWGQKIAECGC